MSKATKITIIVLLVAVLAISCGACSELGGKTRSGPSEDSGEGLDVIEQAWDIIFTEYVEKDKIDAVNLTRAAIEGMVEALDDPYTSYLDIRDYEVGESRLRGEFEGIGAHVTIEDERLTIIAPIAGSPAEGAGIKAGDKILEIEGVSTEEMSLAEGVLRIRGPRGTSVKLLILHVDESNPLEIEIIRDLIEVSSVRFEMREDIAYINITQFSERTDEEMLPVLQSTIENNARGIILDLRHNPGGLLGTVVNVVSYFLQEGVVVNVVRKQEIVDTHEVRTGGLIIDLPIVVLVDGASASGSEVLAGALQDHDRAIIAGKKTFGKGSVNSLYPLDDGSGIYLTSARWTTPNGRLIEGEGIEPDFELELEDEDSIQWAMEYLTGM